MEPYLRMPLIVAIITTLLGTSPITSAQTLTNAESKALLNEVLAKEELDRKNFKIVDVGEYRMNGVKLPDSFAKMPQSPTRTCYFLGKVVEIENGKVVFDDQIESITRKVSCPSSVSPDGSK
jgi:hypothetical protein